MLRTIGRELKAHAPFSLVGALTGVVIMGLLSSAAIPRSFSTTLFWGLHPLHVLLSALVAAGMYRLHSHSRLGATILVGYFGSIGIATLSDCIIPYLGESLLRLPNKGVHFGFIEKWWLVNPLAALGIAIAYSWPSTKFPHAGHVLLSTWASLFHMVMALGDQLSLLEEVSGDPQSEVHHLCRARDDRSECCTVCPHGTSCSGKSGVGAERTFASIWVS
jgi:hypothetical protein